MLLLFSYYSYDRLTTERVISTIEFRTVAPDTYRARLMVPGELDQLFELQGDEWQMDARIVNWTPPATILGLEPIYRLERLSGRYSEIEREKNEPRTVHALTESQKIDVWAVARRFPVLMPGVDAYYGTATYVPMADGARFEVSLTRDAIIARPINEKAREATPIAMTVRKKRKRTIWDSTTQNKPFGTWMRGPNGIFNTSMPRRRLSPPQTWEATKGSSWDTSRRSQKEITHFSWTPTRNFVWKTPEN